MIEWQSYPSNGRHVRWRESANNIRATIDLWSPETVFASNEVLGPRGGLRSHSLAIGVSYKRSASASSTLLW